MSGSRSSALGVIALIIGATGLGLALFNIFTSIINTDIAPVTQARAYVDSSYLISAGSWQTINFNLETFDSGNNFDLSIDRYTAPIAGYYVINSRVSYNNPQDGESFLLAIRINSIQVSTAMVHASNTHSISVSVSEIRWLDANDNIDSRTYHYGGGDRMIYGGSLNTFISISLL